jgi:YesN/AraC family two-component response regulator
LPEYYGISPEEKKKIFDWEIEITERLASSFFTHLIILPLWDENGNHHSDDSVRNLLLYVWNLEPKAWETNIARFRERLIKTSSQITRLGVEVIASNFFTSCDMEERPCHVLRRIEEQYYFIGKGTHSEIVQKAMQYILNHVEERIMLQDVANFAHISPGYLSTLFKREYNQNLVDFINQTKIDRACELLRENKYRINEISYLLGYENAFYFSRVFRRHTGITPSEFKEKA